jgi:hypothetical protein
MLIAVFGYILIGFFYMYYRVVKDLMPDLWSPIQPLASIFIWPLIVIADAFRWINKNQNP